MTEVLVPHPDPIQAGVWKYLEAVNQPAVYGCAKQVYGGALLDGGFDDQAGAAVACGAVVVCTPTSLTVPSDTINDPVEIYYRVNYGDVVGDIEMYEPDIILPANAQDVIADLVVNAGGDLSGLVVTGGGGIAAFQYSAGVLMGGDGSASPVFDGGPSVVAVTINLLTFSDAGATGEYDFVADVFGASVSVHSCGAQNWPGV